jgi:hypothetical protein
MNIKYVISRPDGSHAAPVPIWLAMRRLRKQARNTGPRWRIKERGEDDWGMWRDKVNDVIVHARDRVTTMGIGDVLLVDGENHPYTITIRKVDVEPPVIQTEGNSKVDQIYTYVIRKYHVMNYGICNRRYIDGTTDWTQHAPWPDPDKGSNAWDIGAVTQSMLYTIATDLVGQAKGGQLPIYRVIVGNKIWDSVQGWHTYTGEFHTHVHAEGTPDRTGQPRSSCP